MSTANKLTYLNVTKQKLKQAINNIGGEVTDETTFRQYANQLQNVYDNLPKTEYQEGTEVNLGVTSKGKLDYDNGVVGIGQTEQDGTPTPSTPIDINSVTGNQDVVVSGKNLFDKNNANAINSYFNNTTPTLSTTSNNYRSYYIECKPNTQYTFSKIQTARFSVGYTTTDVSVGTSVSGVITDNTATSITITTGENAKYLIAFVYHSSYDTSVTIQQILDSIMICEGTDTTYEPYITPTSYQLSLGDYKFYGIGSYKDTIRRSSGKNLWGGIGTFGSLSSGARTNSDGTIDVSITGQGVTSVTTPGAVQNNLTKILKPGTYTFTAKNLVTYMYCQILKVNSATSGEVFQNISASPHPTTRTFTITENMEYFIRIQANTGVTFNGTIMPMIEEGSTATDYEPYGVGVWYKYGVIGEKIFTQDDGWNVDEFGRAQTDILKNIYKYSTTQFNDYDYLCNRYIEADDIFGPRVKYSFGVYTNGRLFFNSGIIGITTLADWKTFVTNNELRFVYPLATPTYTPITGTLSEQLEAWYNAHSLNGTTIITSNGDLPLVIKCRGLKGE